jgi:UrcA family protein
MTTTFKIIAASFLVTAGLIKGAPTAAAPAPAVNVSTVHTADLDLSTKAGQRALDHRLNIAAREVCGSASDVDLEGKNDVRACRVDVLSKARTQLAGGDATIRIAAAR